MKFNKTRFTIYYLHIYIFAVFLGFFGLLFFLLPIEKESAFEKRKLAVLPVFSWDGFINGKMIDSVDMFLADHFPFRESFVEVSFNIAQNRGIKDDEIGFIDKSISTKLDTTGITPITNETLDNSDFIAGSGENDTTNYFEKYGSEADTSSEKADNSHGMIIYKGMAIQVFGGNNYMAKTYAGLMNLYYSKLKDKDVNMYCCITPSHGEFYLPPSHKNYNESKNIGIVYKNLESGIISVDACEEMHKHEDEYMYFNTDHHWTGLGAYYAYVAFCKKADLEPVPLENMKKKVIKNYLGSLYWLTRDNRLKAKGDSVEYWKLPNKHKATAYTGFNYDIRNQAQVYAEYAAGPNSYGVFLGSDHPILKIESDVKNGKKILVIKNSFGNPFATYLMAHYEQVFVVDYRYYDNSLLKLIEKNGITDVLFLNNSFFANATWHINRIKWIMNGIARVQKPIKPDSTQKNTPSKAIKTQKETEKPKKKKSKE